MAKIILSNIPLNYQDLAKECAELPHVEDELDNVAIYGTNPRLEIDLTFEAACNGYTLFYIGYFDFWYVHTPDGHWKRASIGYDDAFIQTVIEPKNKKEIFKAHIASFDKVHSVFIDRAMS
ncbi:hypothetical protein [Acinetobacter sp. ANC 3813]|uniref:hypothetical protein n=1 Tax=Acinetobacter sp. ANC 3813 TaxID=1977873 RepID=UPI000A341954|nr:hypothetical protein [Acinetobacter sp. ANC 3813]OTG87919.1 hypothetical protein B9T34_16430 [Acinetobacter sp. ANC 3813]